MGGSWLLGSNPFPFFPMLFLNHAPHKIQDAAVCGFRLTGPEASHYTGWVETPSPKVLAEKQWMKPNAFSLPHTFSAQSWVLGSASNSDRGRRSRSELSHFVLLSGKSCSISSNRADLQETRQFPNLSKALGHCYQKLSHLGKGRYKLTPFMTSIHLVSSWCKGQWLVCMNAILVHQYSPPLHIVTIIITFITIKNGGQGK